MKLILPLLALALLITGCSNTLATRRDMYSPSQPSGPHTRSLEDGSWLDRGRPVGSDMQEPEGQTRRR